MLLDLIVVNHARQDDIAFMKLSNPFARSARQFPQLPDQVPQRGTASSRALFKKIFLAQGWQMVGEFPNLPKPVAIISPHTSNIDAWHGFTALLGLGIQITIFGKHTLFKTPLKPLLNWIGVIPVVRHSPQGHTQDIVEIVRKKNLDWHGARRYSQTSRKYSQWLLPYCLRCQYSNCNVLF